MAESVTQEEMRRRLNAGTGFTTDDSQAPTAFEQTNEWIRRAIAKALERCPWVKLQREFFLTLGIDERFLNYPAQVEPRGIMAIGVWDGTRYRQLRRARIPVIADDEPAVAAGEPTSTSGRGIPQAYEVKSQIEFWPRNDEVRKVKIDAVLTPYPKKDSDLILVDDELVLLWAIAESRDNDGETDLADRARARFEERATYLAGAESPGEVIRRGGDKQQIGDPSTLTGYVPTSGVWPSVMPSES